MSGCREKTAQPTDTGPDSGSSLNNAIPVGAMGSAIVELGDMYRSPETYDVKITVLEVVRGEESADLIKEASSSNALPQNGCEYILARIRFEFFARGAPGDKAWSLNGKQFHAFSNEGTPYEIPSIALPEPELTGVLRSGDSLEGWVAFEVAAQDMRPLMIFDQANIWFQLY